MVARASASIDRGATTVALAMRSAGSPVRGSRICEYHLPLTMKPRWELPLVDTARSRILTVATGSVDSESAQGAAMPSVRGASPLTRRSPPTFSSTPCTPRPGVSATAQARSTMYPLAMALRLSGQSVNRSTVCVRGAILQAGRASRALASASSAASGKRPRAAARDQSRESTSTLGSKAPPLRSRQASLAERTSKSSGESLVGVPGAACHRLNSLAWSYPLKIAARRSISPRTRASARCAASRSSAMTRSSSDVPRTFSWKNA